VSTEACSRMEPLLYSLQLSVPQSRGFFSCLPFIWLCALPQLVCDDPNLPGEKRIQVCKVVGFLSEVLPVGLRYANELSGR
jgi:hypothetical protein